MYATEVYYLNPQSEDWSTPDKLGYIYILRNLDPTWYNRIKVGYSYNPFNRCQQLYTTGVPYPFLVYFQWQVPDMRAAEKLAHSILADHRVNDRREHFDVIPFNQRPILCGGEEPTYDDVAVCLDVLIDSIDKAFRDAGIPAFGQRVSSSYDYAQIAAPIGLIGTSN